jgi:hypothetical protein
MMERREFITLIGGAAVSWPIAARAQQAGKVPIIGFLGATTPGGQSQLTAAFVQRLRELGWIEGRTVAIEYRWAEGRSERFAQFAARAVANDVHTSGVRRSKRSDILWTKLVGPVAAARGRLRRQNSTRGEAR